MHDPDLISILMPVYNAEAYLDDCLGSILTQTEPGWELIAVDDFSTDGSFSKLSAAAEKDSRIQVYHNHTKGIIPALRVAWGRSSGGFITRMDADDRMAPEKLAALKGQLQQSGPGHLATGLVKYFSNEGLGAGYLRYEKWLNTLAMQEANYREIYRECTIPSPCWMAYRADLSDCGAFAHGVYPEDYDLCFRFYKQGLRVRSAKQVLHWWRDHSDRASRNDENYANNGFFSLKVPYFLDLEMGPKDEVWLWGAGKKGKAIARLLQQEERPFHWICNNPRKIGKQIYGIELCGPDLLKQDLTPKLIIAVSNQDEQNDIRQFCESRGWRNGEEFYFFT